MAKQTMYAGGGWFQCRNLDRPEWEAFKVLRTSVLPPGTTTRDTMHVLVRLGADVLRDPNGRDRLLEMHRQWRAEAPSERAPLIEMPEVGRAEPDPPVAVAAPEPRMTIQLKHRHSINGVVYGPGDAVEVPAGLAGDLVMADRRADTVAGRGA